MYRNNCFFFILKSISLNEFYTITVHEVQLRFGEFNQHLKVYTFLNHVLILISAKLFLFFNIFISNL